MTHKLKKREVLFILLIYIYISTKYLREAIKKVPSGTDYVILDRCAGSGQLEKQLTDDELSHCVLSTLGIAEWISLWNTYGDKVRCIIPPFVKGKQIDQNTTPEELLKQVDFDKNEVKGADALSEKFYTNNKHLWEGKYIIMLENPPYADATSNMFKNAKKGEFNQSYIKTLIKGTGASSNDLYTQFIWSAFHLVKCSEYIVYGPIKQWKVNHLLNFHFNSGYLCNREKFHATESAIALQWYTNYPENLQILKFDSDNGWREIKKINSKWNLFMEHKSSNEIIAKMVAQGGNRNMMGATLINSDSKATSHVKYIDIDIDNILYNIPLFVCNFYIDKDYTEKEVIMKSADGGINYQKDKEFLNDCAQWTYFTNKNKCTETSKIWKLLEKLCNFDPTLNNDAKNIMRYAGISTWIGLDNIDKNFNTSSEDAYGRKQKDNPLLDGAIKELKKDLFDFYEAHITHKLFDYQLLK